MIGSYEDEGDPTNLTKRVSPLVLKMITENSKYRRAYKSYAFGMMRKMKGKWVWVLMTGVMAFIVVLYATGNLNFIKGG